MLGNTSPSSGNEGALLSTFSLPNPVENGLTGLGNFRIRAVIDFIDIRFKTVDPTQFRWVQDSLLRAEVVRSTPHINRLDFQPGGSTSDFVVRIHDPKDHDHLLQTVQAVEKRSSLKETPSVDRVEVSIDFYSKTHDRDQLEAMTLRLKHSLQHQAAFPSETNSFRHSVEAAHQGSLRANRTYLAVECNQGRMCPGWQDCRNCWNRAFRVYLKAVDNNQKPIEDFKQHRSRVEVSLRGLNIPDELRDVREGTRFKFEDLTRHFAFKTIHDWTVESEAQSVASVIERHKLDIGARLGSSKLYPHKGQRRKTSHRVRADGDLKSRVRDGLRGLTDRHFGYAKKPGEA